MKFSTSINEVKESGSVTAFLHENYCSPIVSSALQPFHFHVDILGDGRLIRWLWKVADESKDEEGYIHGNGEGKGKIFTVYRRPKVDTFHGSGVEDFTFATDSTNTFICDEVSLINTFHNYFDWFYVINQSDVSLHKGNTGFTMMYAKIFESNDHFYYVKQSSITGEQSKLDVWWLTKEGQIITKDKIDVGLNKSNFWDYPNGSSSEFDGFGTRSMLWFDKDIDNGGKQLTIFSAGRHMSNRGSIYYHKLVLSFYPNQNPKTSYSWETCKYDEDFNSVSDLWLANVREKAFIRLDSKNKQIYWYQYNEEENDFDRLLIPYKGEYDLSNVHRYYILAYKKHVLLFDLWGDRSGNYYDPFVGTIQGTERFGKVLTKFTNNWCVNRYLDNSIMFLGFTNASSDRTSDAILCEFPYELLDSMIDQGLMFPVIE